MNDSPKQIKTPVRGLSAPEFADAIVDELTPDAWLVHRLTEMDARLAAIEKRSEEHEAGTRMLTLVLKEMEPKIDQPHQSVRLVRSDVTSIDVRLTAVEARLAEIKTALCDLRQEQASLTGLADLVDTIANHCGMTKQPAQQGS